MNAVNQGLDTLLPELLDVLDAELRRVETTLTRLDELRAAVIKRDEPALAALLNTIQTEQEQAARLDDRRDAVRRCLAEAMGCEVGAANLSRLCSLLPAEQRQIVQTRQRRLKTALAELRRQHYLTNLLLRDCARINRSLLRVLVGDEGQPGTYSPRGANAWKSRVQLMSIRA